MGKSKLNDAPSSGLAAPLCLLVVGLIGVTIYVLTQTQGARAAEAMLAVTFILAVQVVLALAAVFLTAFILKTGFGEIGPALLKLTGIIVFCTALGLWLPLGSIAGAFIFFALMMWLFGVEMYEAVIFGILFFAIRLLAAMMLANVRL